MTSKKDYDADEVFPDTNCPHCGGVAPCEGCRKNHKDPGTSKKGNEMEVTLPLDGTKDGYVSKSEQEEVARMLRKRGYNPQEWVIKSLLVNQWQGMRPKDRGIMPLEQTKAQLVRNVPLSDTPWGQLVSALREATGADRRKPRKILKPIEGKPRLTVLMGDDQAPWISEEAHQAVCEFLSDIQPDRIIHMGDGLDFDQISQYGSQHPQWESEISETLKVFYRIMSERIDAAGSPEVHFLEGNHEHRLQKYLLNKAKPLYGIKRPDEPEDAADVLSVRSLAGFDSLGINLVENPLGNYPYPGLEIAPNLFAYHGWVARKKAGLSVLATIETMNASAAVGHTHRLAVTGVTRWIGDESVTYTGIETGTLAQLPGLGYTKNPDWQAGVVTVVDWPDGTFTAEIARFENNTLTWRDQRWEITATGVRRGS